MKMFSVHCEIVRKLIRGLPCSFYFYMFQIVKQKLTIYFTVNGDTIPTSNQGIRTNNTQALFGSSLFTRAFTQYTWFFSLHNPETLTTATYSTGVVTILTQRTQHRPTPLFLTLNFRYERYLHQTIPSIVLNTSIPL